MKNDKWTFGISLGESPYHVGDIVSSIRNQSVAMKDYEIILIGNCQHPLVKSIEGSDIKKIEFDESIKNRWITKKKNIIAQEAKFDNISIHHDYVFLHRDWYRYFLDFKEDWNVCMTRIENLNGSRYRDWVTWSWTSNIDYVDYLDNSRTHEMYVSGCYWCVKKNFMLQHPLDENKCWGQGEDVEWSERIRVDNLWKYCCNWKSKVLLKNNKDSYIPHTNDSTLGWYSNWNKQNNEESDV